MKKTIKELKIENSLLKEKLLKTIRVSIMLVAQFDSLLTMICSSNDIVLSDPVASKLILFSESLLDKMGSVTKSNEFDLTKLT